MDNEGIDEVGLSHSQAIQLFVKAVINRGGIPFELKARQPNKTSIAAIKVSAGHPHRERCGVNAV